MVWAIGDIQGCYKHFMNLLEKIDFDPTRDRLWLVGDLVNRGKGSLETLEYLYTIRESVTMVLGNHDMTLIATYCGLKKGNPTIDPILKSPNASLLVEWLRSQKFFHYEEGLGYCMSHAGISPEFDLESVTQYAREIENRLHADNYREWLNVMIKGSSAGVWDTSASEAHRECYILSSLTRMRFCRKDLSLDFNQKGSPKSTLIKDKSLIPWFKSPKRQKITPKILFGHWSTLGYYNDESVCCLDTGCVWDGEMTAMRIDDGSEEVVSVRCDGE